MNDLGKDARDLLSLTRGAHDPAAGAKARVRLGLAAALAAPASVALEAGVTSRAARSATWLSAPRVAFLALAVAGGAALLLSRAKSAPPAPATMPATMTMSPLPPPTAAPAPVPAAPLPASAPPAIAAVPSPPPAARPPRAPTDEGSVAAEVAILRRVSDALRSGDPKGALAGVAEHARRFPNGALAEERETERIVALCALGRRDEAARATQRFTRAWPSSSHASRIQAACAAPASSEGAP